nr:MAG TPA: antitoxin [Caudoviricetes sp.]
MLGLEILLRESNLSRKDVAEKLNVQVNNISMWLKNKKIPKKHLKALASILSSDESYINSIIEIASLDSITKEIQDRTKGEKVGNEKVQFLEDRLHISEQDKMLLQASIEQLQDEIEALKYCQDEDLIAKMQENFDKTLITLRKENRQLNNIICSLKKENTSLRRENKRVMACRL